MKHTSKDMDLSNTSSVVDATEDFIQKDILLKGVKPTDLIEYGLIPEFVGTVNRTKLLILINCPNGDCF